MLLLGGVYGSYGERLYSCDFYDKKLMESLLLFAAIAPSKTKGYGGHV